MYIVEIAVSWAFYAILLAFALSGLFLLICLVAVLYTERFDS